MSPAYEALALLKLNRIAEAEQVLTTSDTSTCFALRYMNAYFPAFTQNGLEEAVCRLEELNTQLSREGALCRQRALVVCTMISLHIEMKQYIPALHLMNNMLIEDPCSAFWYSQAGRLQLLFGDIAAAQTSFNQSRRFAIDRKSMEMTKLDTCFIKLVTEGADVALSSFDQLEEESNCPIRANGAALCHVMGGRPEQATLVIENTFLQAPLDMIDECMILNASLLYKLNPHGVEGLEKRRKMSAWLAAVAPDDFDLSVCN